MLHPGNRVVKAVTIALSQLQSLSCTVADEILLQAICTLPQLRTLWINPSCETSFVSLESVPQLTSLTLCDDMYNSLLPIVEKLHLSKLQHFGIVRPLLFSGSFLSFCTSPLMQGVRPLQLDQYWRGSDEASDLGIDEPPVGGAEFAAGFAALKHVEEIMLTRVSDLDCILQHLVRAPALTRPSGARHATALHILIAIRCGPANDARRASCA